MALHVSGESRISCRETGLECVKSFHFKPFLQMSSMLILKIVLLIAPFSALILGLSGMLRHIAAALVITLFFQAPAHAYLDAGTGSMILQAILGGVAGLIVLGKMYWKEFMGLIRGRGADKGQSGSE